jgi:hypothetical protein
MDHKVFESFLNSIRWLLLLIAAVALLVGALWQFDEALVNRFSNAVVDSYMGFYQRRLDIATEEAEQGDPAQLVSFLASISGTEKGDRLDPIKRQAFKIIIETYQAQNNIGAALEWSEDWKQFDDRDFQASLINAELLMSTEESYAEGLQALADLNKKLPYVQAVSDVYLGELLGTQKFLEAYLVVDRASDQYLGGTRDWMRRTWMVYWDSGRSFNGKEKLSVEPKFGDSGELILEFELEANIKKLRMDPPPNFELFIHAPEIATGELEQKVVQKLANLPLTLHQMSNKSGTLKTDGGDDPYFYWNQPEQLIFPHRQNWVFTARVRERLPEALAPLFERDVALKIIQALNLDENQPALRRYMSLFKLSHGLESDVEVDEYFSREQAGTDGFRDESHKTIRARTENDGGMVEKAQ